MSHKHAHCLSIYNVMWITSERVLRSFVRSSFVRRRFFVWSSCSHYTNERRIRNTWRRCWSLCFSGAPARPPCRPWGGLLSTTIGEQLRLSNIATIWTPLKRIDDNGLACWRRRWTKVGVGDMGRAVGRRKEDAASGTKHPPSMNSKCEERSKNQFRVWIDFKRIAIGKI